MTRCVASGLAVSGDVQLSWHSINCLAVCCLCVQSYGPAVDPFVRQSVADDAAHVSRALAPSVLRDFFSKPGVFQAGWIALSSSSTWAGTSSLGQLLVLLKAAAFSLPTAGTCWGGRLPMGRPDFICKQLLEGLLTAAGADYSRQLPVLTAGCGEALGQLLAFVEQLPQAGRAALSFEETAELNALADRAVAACWQQLQTLVA